MLQFIFKILFSFKLFMISPFMKSPNDYFLSPKPSNYFKSNKYNTKLPKLKKRGGNFHQKILNAEQLIPKNELPTMLKQSKSIDGYRNNNLYKQTDGTIQNQQRKQLKAEEESNIKSQIKVRLQTQIDMADTQINKNMKMKNQQQQQFATKPNEIINTEYDDRSNCSSKQLQDFLDDNIDLHDFQKQIRQNREIIKKQTENRRKEISQYLQQSYQRQTKINQSQQYSQRHRFSKYRKELKENKMFMCIQPTQKKKIFVPKIKMSQKLKQPKIRKKSSLKRLNSQTPSVVVPSLILKREKSSLISDQNTIERNEPSKKMMRHNSEQFQMKKVKSLVGFKEHIIILQNKYRQIQKKEAERNNYYNIKKSLSSQQQNIQSQEILKSPSGSRKWISPVKLQSINETDINHEIQCYNRKFSKNERCLEDYISTRKMLMELEIQQRYNAISRNNIWKSLSPEIQN